MHLSLNLCSVSSEQQLQDEDVLGGNENDPDSVGHNDILVLRIKKKIPMKNFSANKYNARESQTMLGKSKFYSISRILVSDIMVKSNKMFYMQLVD